MVFIRRENRKFKKNITAVIAASFALTAIPVLAQEAQNYTIHTPYAHAVPIGTAEWAELTWEEKAELNQLPMAIAQGMTTEALAETVITYPNFPLVYTSNYPSKILTFALDNYNGFTELLKREDAGTVLLNLYKGIDTSLALGSDDVEWVRMYRIEVLLGHETIFYSIMDNPETVEIIEKKYYEKKEARPDSAFINSFFETLDIDLDTKIELFDFPITELLSNYDMYEMSLIQSLSDFEAYTDRFHYLYTPKGTRFAAKYQTAADDYDTTERARIDREIDSANPDAVRIAGASKIYNCHSYAFYQYGPANYANYWFEVEDAQLFIDDESFWQIYGALYKDDLVFYSRGDKLNAIRPLL